MKRVNASMLTMDEIKKAYSKKFFDRGLLYAREGHVKELHWNEKKQRVTAKVYGSRPYKITISFPDVKAISDDCTCPAFETYGECKHITAVLIELANRSKQDRPVEDHITSLFRTMFTEDRWDEASTASNVPKKNTDAGQRLVEEFAGMIHPAPSFTGVPFGEEKTTLDVESAVLFMPNPDGIFFSLAVELKVGEDRLFRVKDIREFLDAVKKGHDLYFTKSFSYEPEHHQFTEQDQELLDVLHIIYENEQFYDATHMYDALKKRLHIPLAYSEDLLHIAASKGSMAIDSNGRDIGELRFIQEELPFTFSVTRDEDILTLHVASVSDAMLLEEAPLLADKEKLYPINDRQRTIFQLIRTQLKKLKTKQSDPDAIYFSRDDEEAFFTHLLPKLELIGPVSLSDDALEHVNYQPFSGKVTLDLTDEYRLTADVAYHYGDQVIRPFGEVPFRQPVKPDANKLVRDTEHEQRIMAVIEQADFHYNGHELYLIEEEQQYRFLFELLPYLAREADVYYSESLKNILAAEAPAPVVELNYQESGNYLEAGFDMPGVSKDQLQALLGAIVEKKRFFRLSSGEVIPLRQDHFSQVEQLVTGLGLNPDEMVDGKVKLPGYRSLEAEEILRKEGKTRYSRAFKELLEAIRHPESGDTPLPEGLTADLRQYQVTGFQWLTSLSSYGFGGVLADDMGLGKTLQAIAYLLHEKTKAEKAGVDPGQALVISPASLTHNWKNELEKFAPTLRAHVIDGAKAERIAAFREAVDADVVITSYPKARQDDAELTKRRYTTLILDESQAIKNPATKIAKTVKTIPANRRFALSGTPVENSLDELWAVFDAVMPGLFPGKKAFRQLSDEAISRISRPFILRRLKQDVLTELPDKIESVQYSELTDDQKSLYLAYLERIQGEASQAIQSDGFQQSRMKILAGLTRLRQLCCHPSLFIEDYEGESGKLNDLLELVANAVENGRRLLIFSQFSSMLTMMKEVLEQAGYDLFYLDGQTPGKARVEMAERFNQGEKELFLISLKAGGTGLNLPGADLVVLYDLWWNPAVEEQAAGRAHRMGQKKVVQVIRMVSQGTIEEKIHELQKRKKELIDTVIQPGESSISSLTEDDIRELLSF
ncbi:putative ATP-dependent helicase [Salisediminibacterium beveridgei]|uniref:Putative ATP-dependent helicase n=2 Tax=Salisediminibacterium beveridgei TaxID=632773 RepID=A0A1D7QS27_9BACI|nr:putative ATP-dependent helicase [Salisediminibacterium beveridgei]